MPGTWDGKTRPTSETYRSNYDDIFKRKDHMLIRLMFEPEPGVKCNVDKMFRCYAENYLSDFPEFQWGGFIMMNVLEHKYTKTLNGEPFYQFVASNVSDSLLAQISEYVKANPMYGYHTHIHYSVNGENEISHS
jgi:hypothetical protein